MMARFTAQGIAAVAVTCAMGLPVPASAGTNTAAILANSFKAAPSCASYSIEGVCFFLRCGWGGCRIRTSIKVSHYVPDVVVSTYNAPTQHPWSDLGALVATMATGAGSAIVGQTLDSSAGGLDSRSAMANFKGADAIGNPAGRFAAMLGGGSVSVPATLSIPGVTELASFPGQVGSIASQWGQVPANIASTVASDAKALAQAPQSLLSGVQSVMGAIQGVQQVMQVARYAQDVQAAVQGLQQLASLASSMGAGSTLFCPGGASMFNLHFQSELDAPFWRGILPVEMIYPQTWVPGLNEVGSGYSQTWGNVYPRTGELIQPHPVKASAVLAERVASIINQSAQPHVYTKVSVTEGGSYRYFKKADKHKWQMLYPQVWSSCVEFGSNDSLALTSFGDGQTDSADGYAWNLWQRYSCCRRRGTFLYSIP